MRSAAPLTLVALVLAAALALPRERGPDAAVPVAASPDGSFSISNDPTGSAIFTVADLAPGHSAGGTVTVSNDGTLPGRFTLAQADLQDAPGPGGGELSERVELAVRDTATSGAPVYLGPLRALGARPLGSFAPGESRTYSFTVSLPDGDPVVDNAYAGASASVRYVWTGEAPPPSDAPGVDAPPASPAPPGQTPGLTLRAAAGQPALDRRRLFVRLRATDVYRFSVWAWVEDPSGRPRFLRGRLAAYLAANRTRRLGLRLPAAPRRLLREARRAGRPARVHVLVIASGPSGAPVTLRREVPVRVTLKPAGGR